MNTNMNLNTNKKIAVIVGVLFIIGTAAGISSVIFTGPVLGSPDYLNLIAANPNPVVSGALMVLVMGLALAMVPVVIFPVLKKHNEVLALGYVILRGALEPIAYIAMAFSWLMLGPLSLDYVAAGAPAVSYYQTMGFMLLETARISAALCAIVFPLGAIMFYVVLYQGKLIPRWISVWGLLAVILHLISAGVGGLYTLDPSLTPIKDLLVFPILIQEMVMAVWLIIKGFNTTTMVSRTVSK